MKAWIVFYDKDDDGGRENWNTFYTYHEVYVYEVDARDREQFLNAAGKRAGYIAEVQETTCFQRVNQNIPDFVQERIDEWDT